MKVNIENVNVLCLDIFGSWWGGERVCFELEVELKGSDLRETL